MVEIFKTKVKDENEGSAILELLQESFPTYSINLDLEDCDKILRVENVHGSVNYEEVLNLTKTKNIPIYLWD